MAIWAVGDVQGCCSELELLIHKLQFDPDRDRLWSVGDLVNRGPQSLETLRLVKSLGEAAVCVLGNHDLHLLALHANPATPVKDVWLQTVLQADDRDELLAWLRHLPLAHFDGGLNTLLVHAGVAPAWTAADAVARAAEVEAVLRSDEHEAFLTAMYGSRPTRWDDSLTGMDRLRFITNCLTRIRYCAASGELEFTEKFAPGTQPAHLLPWFELPERAAADTRIVFGHWSTLGYLERPGLLATDTGCVWGDQLTAVRLDGERTDEPQVVQVESLQPKKFAGESGAGA